jgi:hypothetical protein
MCFHLKMVGYACKFTSWGDVALLQLALLSTAIMRRFWHIYLDLLYHQIRITRGCILLFFSLPVEDTWGKNPVMFSPLEWSIMNVPALVTNSCSLSWGRKMHFFVWGFLLCFLVALHQGGSGSWNAKMELVIVGASLECRNSIICNIFWWRPVKLFLLHLQI